MGLPKGRTNNPNGRPPGAKGGKSIMIAEGVEAAFQKLGGVDWLVKLAKKDPKIFVPLLNKVIGTNTVTTQKHEGTVTFNMVPVNTPEEAKKLEAKSPNQVQREITGIAAQATPDQLDAMMKEIEKLGEKVE